MNRDQNEYDEEAPQVDISCPFCQLELEVSPSQAGTTISCPECDGKFQVPLPTARRGPRSGDGFYDEDHEKREFINKKMAAGLCGILLEGMGVHKFILGFNTAGVIMLVISMSGAITGACLIVPIIAPMVMGTIGLIEGILYLTKSDEDFYQEYYIDKKEWF